MKTFIFDMFRHDIDNLTRDDIMRPSKLFPGIQICVKVENGEYWYKNTIEHREGGPATTYRNGMRVWKYNGFLHREDGPVYENSIEVDTWYIHGKRLTKEEFDAWRKANGK